MNLSKDSNRDVVKDYFCLIARFIIGFVFFCAPIRRWIFNADHISSVYFENKLSFLSENFYPQKLLMAAPNSPLHKLLIAVTQQEHLISFLAYFIDAAEGIVGVLLILGVLTRLMSLFTCCFLIFLMLTFGWLGSTCNDDWTMYSAMFALIAPLMVLGAGRFSLDACLPITRMAFYFNRHLKIFLKMITVIVIVYSVGFYQYFHRGLTGPVREYANMEHLKLTNLQIQSTKVCYDVMMDAGNETTKIYILQAQLFKNNQLVKTWDGAALRQTIIENYFRQVWAPKVYVNPVGLSVQLGATAHICLINDHSIVRNQSYRLELLDINGEKWFVVY